MKDGDEIRVINGNHRGKTGVVSGKGTIKQVGALEEEREIGWWIVIFEDGSSETIHESEMEIIEPE